MNDILSLAIDQVASDDLHDFYFYEPWDVKERKQWVIDLALKDGVDLNDPQSDIGRICGPAPHPFQGGYHRSCKPLRSLVAGSRVGKSYSALIELVIILTGEVPFSMRYPVGVDTGIKRKITRGKKGTIRTFGRWRDGVLLDYDDSVPEDGTWDCGNIIGCGVFPIEKIAQPGQEAWLGTYMKPSQTYWEPRIDPSSPKCVIPPHFFDTKRSRTGFDRINGVVYLSRNTILRIVTYESGYNRFEAGQDTIAIALDEEPTDQRIFTAARTRCKYLTLVMTPYNGMTYTREKVFPKERKRDSDTFHATQYDSPYQDLDEIRVNAETYREWERAARIWGAYAEQRGAPYFNRTKLNIWLQKYDQPYFNAEFVPSRNYFGIQRRPDVTNLPTLLEIKSVMMRTPIDIDNLVSIEETWRIYEDRKPETPYILVADTSTGADEYEDRHDYNAAGIARPGDDVPIIVATIRTKRSVVEFAQSCLLACRYYNNALLCAESYKRGASNALFYSETKHWPWWWKMAVMNDTSRRIRDIPGFDTNSKTREMIFGLINDHINSFEADQYPMIPDRDLLKELAACVKGRNGRADHTKDGTLDSAIWFGILLYVWKYGRDQIVFNGEPEVKESKIMRALRRITDQQVVKPGYARAPAAIERR